MINSKENKRRPINEIVGHPGSTCPPDQLSNIIAPATAALAREPVSNPPAPSVVSIPTITQSLVSAVTNITYKPLTASIPQSVAYGASSSEFPRMEAEDAAWWQKTPGHQQVSMGDYYTLQGKTHLPAIYVYPAAAFAELVPAAFESIHRLQNYLYAPENVPTLD